MRLISDVWYPLMHVVKPDFLLMDGIWGQCWLDTTCVVLSWVLTHLFRLDICDELGKFEYGKCPIPADLFTAAICKADGPMPNDRPQPLHIPLCWNQRKNPAYSYGALKFVNLARGAAEGVVDEGVEREMRDPESGITMPKIPSNVDLRELFDLSNIFDQVEYLMEMLRVRAQAFRVIEADARKNAEAVEGKFEAALVVIKEHKLAMHKATNDMQRKMLVERFIVEGKQLFVNTEKVEKVSAAGGGDARRVLWLNTTDILAGFSAFIGILNREEYFKQYVDRYESGYDINGSYGVGMQGRDPGWGQGGFGNAVGYGGYNQPGFGNRGGFGRQQFSPNGGYTGGGGMGYQPGNGGVMQGVGFAGGGGNINYNNGYVQDAGGQYTWNLNGGQYGGQNQYRVHQEKKCGVRTPLWCLLTPVSRPCLLGIHMSPVTTPLPFYSTSSPLLSFLTHVFSPSPTGLSPSHAPHLHSD